VPRIKSSVDALVRNYDEKVDKALVLNSLVKYAAQPAQRNAAFDAVVGIKDGMSKADLQAALDKLYAGSKLGDAAERKAWLERKPEDFKASDDAFIKAAVALYEPDLKSEADDEELGGKLQQAYGNYMKAKIAYMNSKGQAVYPDANSTLRVTFGKIAGRDKAPTAPRGRPSPPWKAWLPKPPAKASSTPCCAAESDQGQGLRQVCRSGAEIGAGGLPGDAGHHRRQLRLGRAEQQGRMDRPGV
jgi:hypothetical protein